MKFVCEKSVLLKILNNVSRSVSAKSNILSIEGIHITVENSVVYFEGFNMEFGVKTSLSVEDSKDGSIVIPAKIFTDIIKKMPDALISVRTENLSVFIDCLDCNFVISGISPEEFPKLPSVGSENFISISSEIVRNMIQQTIFAVADSGENKSVHSGELLEVKQGILSVVAVDGFRMAVRREHVNISQDFKIIIPGKALAEILKLLPNEEKEIKIYLSERYAFFHLEDYVFLSRLLEGNFIDYSSAIPTECSTRIKINVRELISSLERVSVVVSDRLQNPVKAVIEPPGRLKFSCYTSVGRSNDELDCEVSGEALEISFNDKFMIDALKNCDTDEVIVETTSALKPIKIIPLQGDSFVFLVLPVRVKDDNQ